MFVWLASYPKSGSTWLRAALWSLHQGGASVDFSDMAEFGGLVSRRRDFDAVLGVESSDLKPAEIDDLRSHAVTQMAKRLRSSTLSKVHDAWRRNQSGESIFPAEATAGVIYLVRDPRAIASSWAHHTQVSVDTAIDFMCSTSASLGAMPDRGTATLPATLLTWSEHVDSWLHGPSTPPEMIRYEDMWADPAPALERVARVLGWPAPPDAVDRAVRATTFDTMRAAERDQGFAERPVGMPAFFRRGSADAWRDELSLAQISRIEQHHGDWMRRLGYL